MFGQCWSLITSCYYCAVTYKNYPQFIQIGPDWKIVLNLGLDIFLISLYSELFWLEWYFLSEDILHPQIRTYANTMLCTDCMMEKIGGKYISEVDDKCPPLKSKELTVHWKVNMQNQGHIAVFVQWFFYPSQTLPKSFVWTLAQSSRCKEAHKASLPAQPWPSQQVSLLPLTSVP